MFSSLITILTIKTYYDYVALSRKNRYPLKRFAAVFDKTVKSLQSIRFNPSTRTKVIVWLQ